jgi:anti-sigma factor RsiW
MIHDDRWLEMLSAHVDGELSPDEEQQVHSHLAGCIDCRRTVAGMRSVISAAASAPRTTGTSPDWESLVARLQRPSAKARGPVSTGMALAASIALLIVVGGGAWWLDRTADRHPDAVSSDTASVDRLIAEVDAWARRNPNDPLAAELLAVIESTRSHRDRQLMLSTLIP